MVYMRGMVDLIDRGANGRLLPANQRESPAHMDDVHGVIAGARYVTRRTVKTAFWACFRRAA
jgi:hypothetical protein